MSDEEEEVPEVTVDASGHPVLPASYVARLKARQDVVREVFTKAYGKFELSYSAINILTMTSENHQP